MQNLLEVIAQASNVQRYSRDFMVHREHLLDHIGFMCVFCYFVAGRLSEQGYTVRLGRLLSRAVAHDLEEVITGDVPRPTKHSSPEVTAALKVHEVVAVNRLIAILRVDFAQDWAEAKADDLEGDIIKLGDMAAVVYKTMSEVAMLGNKSFIRVSDEITVEMDKLVLKMKDHPLEWIVLELSDLLARSRSGDIRFGAFFKGL
jgi:5'-deoxynucleotidase YfbR-like HD superfamily hydrolase